MKPDGSGQRSLTRDFAEAYAPTWSPDGAQILFRGPAGDFYVVDGEGGKLKKILEFGDVAADFPGVEWFKLDASASWLADSKTIFVCVGSWPYSSNVYLIEIASSKRTTLPLAKAAWSPAWSPDGNRIAFVTYNSAAMQETQPFQIWLADMQGAHQVPVCGECDLQAGPLWLPDSKRLIFIKRGAWANGKQHNTLCMKNVESGELSEADFSWDVFEIAVSPDGQKIAFSERGPPIYIFHLKGSAWEQGETIENGWLPTWSPDSTSLAFVSSDDHQIWLANMDGSGRVRLAPTTEPVAPVGPKSSEGSGALVSEVEWPKWSPRRAP